MESVASVLREKLCASAELLRVDSARETLRALGLPGESALAQGLNALREMSTGDSEAAVQSFLQNADTLAKTFTRARAIEERVTEPMKVELERAQLLLMSAGPALEAEAEAPAQAREAVARLRDHLLKETFYDHLPTIQRAAGEIKEAFQVMYHNAFSEYRSVYQKALAELHQAPGWPELEEATKSEIGGRLQERADLKPESEPWRRGSAGLTLLREQTLAAGSLLEQALQALRRALTPQAVEIRIRSFLSGPITSQEELNAVLSAIREEVERALAQGRPVVLI